MTDDRESVTEAARLGPAMNLKQVVDRMQQEIQFDDEMFDDLRKAVTDADWTVVQEAMQQLANSCQAALQMADIAAIGAQMMQRLGILGGARKQ